MTSSVYRSRRLPDDSSVHEPASSGVRVRGHADPAVIVVVLALWTGGCGRPSPEMESGGDPKQGAILLSAHGCGSCHTIPGVSGASGTIGPPLARYARRAYIAGKLPNQPENLTRWIRNPGSIEPGTAMPNLPVNGVEAGDMAAYLYTLY